MTAPSSNTSSAHISASALYAELRVFRFPASVCGSTHDLKYSLALMVNRISVLRHDNETGKVDHKHVGEIGMP